MITTKTVLHKTEKTFPRCDHCASPATHGVFDNVEVDALPGEWREFKLLKKERRGCAEHPVASRTLYLDHRVLLTSECVPERVPWPSADQLS